MIDTHCHLDSALFADDRNAALARAHAVGVTDIVVPAVDVASWARVRRLRAECSRPRVHAALGIHPVALVDAEATSDAESLAALAAVLDEGNAIAVGECGLDATIDLERAPWERQEDVFVAQLGLAKRLALPIILHARGFEAYTRLCELLERHGLGQRPGILHSYGGGVDLAARFGALPLYFGFAGPATYRNNRKVRASMRALPLARLLAETDAPDQCPEPHRPGRSEPAYVAEVIAGMAAACELSVAEMRTITTHNARTVFGLAP